MNTLPLDTLNASMTNENVVEIEQFEVVAEQYQNCCGILQA